MPLLDSALSIEPECATRLSMSSSLWQIVIGMIQSGMESGVNESYEPFGELLSEMQKQKKR